jgi:ADP-ribosylglycohydrolase
MPSPNPKNSAALFGVCLALLGCSKEAEAPPPPAAEVAPAPAAAAAHPTPVAPAAVATVQQVNANWDAVSQQIANQDYDNAVRQAIQLNRAQQQAQLSEAVRNEYARRLYQAQEALRQKAETDAKAREAYQKLGQAMMGR